MITIKKLSVPIRFIGSAPIKPSVCIKESACTSPAGADKERSGYAAKVKLQFGYDHLRRNTVKEKIGQGKGCYGLGQIREELAEGKG